MNFSKYTIVTVFILIVTLSACSPTENSAANEIEGIELELTVNEQEMALDEEVIANVALTNHNNSRKEIFVPIPQETEEAIAAVMIERENEMLSQFLIPENNQEISNIKKRSFYDFISLELEANETIEQEFRWNKKLVNQKDSEMVEANRGEYLLSAFVILDELTEEKEYYDPEKQLISTLKFTVKK